MHHRGPLFNPCTADPSCIGVRGAHMKTTGLKLPALGRDRVLNFEDRPRNRIQRSCTQPGFSGPKVGRTATSGVRGACDVAALSKTPKHCQDCPWQRKRMNGFEAPRYVTRDIAAFNLFVSLAIIRGCEAKTEFTRILKFQQGSSARPPFVNKYAHASAVVP